MFTQFLGTAATVYGALKSLLQAQQMLARRTSGVVSTCAPLSATAAPQPNTRRWISRR
jgi:hypothetical protein